MVTVRQIVKSYSASVRASERRQKQKARNAALLYKAQAKHDALVSASEKVKQYNEYLDVITSIHKNCTDPIDWNLIQEDPEPPPPENDHRRETEAKENLDRFKPNFFQKIFGSKRNLSLLNYKLDQGKKEDQEEFERAKTAYGEWQSMQEICRGVKSNNPVSYKKAIEYFDPFSDISVLGTQIKFSFNSNYVELDLHVKTSEIIPDFVLTVTQTGKLSRKPMPISKFNELYQDYICGCVLRVARESLSYLPVKAVGVHAIAELLNSSTGHLEEVPIISGLFFPETIEKLNFETLDPSDSLKNFIHNMKFSKVNGFSQVDKINVSERISS